MGLQHRLVGRGLGAGILVEQRELTVVGGGVGAQFTPEVPQGEVIEVERSLPRTYQIGGERGVTGDPAETPAATPKCVERPLGLVDGFGSVGVGQPVGDRLLVRRPDLGRIEVCRLAIGRSDRDACDVRPVDLPGPDNRQACPAGAGRRVRGEPIRHLARAELAAP